MAAYKFTVKRGETSLAQIAVATGADEAQGNTISLNIDVASSNPVGKAEVLMMIDKLKAKIVAEPWPPLA